jgi:hypothetical protein
VQRDLPAATVLTATYLGTKGTRGMQEFLPNTYPIGASSPCPECAKTFNRFTDADKERQIEEALMLGDPITDLTIAMELDYFQLNRAEYFVPFIVKIPGRELALAKRFGVENKVVDRVPISSVVLSSQRVNLNDALYNPTHGKDAAKNDAANPLVVNGQKFIPSVPRVFSRDRQLYVYLQAYQHAAPSACGASVAPAPAPPVFAYVSLYRDGKLALETVPVAVAPKQDTRLGIVPLSLEVGLGDLVPGSYQCQISVLDPAGARVTFWQGAIMVL